MEDDDYIIVLFVAVAAYFFLRSRGTAATSGGYYNPTPPVSADGYYYPLPDGGSGTIINNSSITAPIDPFTGEMTQSFANDPWSDGMNASLANDPWSDGMNASLTNDPVMSQSGNPISMTLSDTGAAFIKQQEGFSATPYPDGNGYSGGYGHHFVLGETVPLLISYDQANMWFSNDVARAINAIQTSVMVPLTQGQFDALVDFIFNEGVAAFKSSTLLTMLNTGDTMGAGQQFSRWNISGGQVNPVLVARRIGDQQMWTA